MRTVPELPDPNLDAVRSALRAHDHAPEREREPEPEPEPAGPPPVGQGPSEMQEGVSTTRLDPDGEERFQLLRRELGVSAFGLNYLRLRPRQRGRIHAHERQEEVYVVLEGTLTLVIEGEERTLARGEVARVAPAVRRQLANRGDETLLVLTIGGDGAHEGRDGVAFTAWKDREARPIPEVPLPPDLDR